MSKRLGPTRLKTVTTADRWKAAIGRIEGKLCTFDDTDSTAIPRRTRLLSSTLFFLFCLGGLFWADHLEAKYPPTEKDKQQLEDLKKFRLPSRADFAEAREQALRAQAAGVEPKAK